MDASQGLSLRCTGNDNLHLTQTAGERYFLGNLGRATALYQSGGDDGQFFADDVAGPYAYHDLSEGDRGLPDRTGTFEY